MEACGVIVEYNPFHNGHAHHVQEAKRKTESDCIIAVMSGPFLQRGEPAIIDPFYRAQAALSHGVDIVVVLPFFYAVQSSDLFAYGAVHTLNHLGISSICFGSESGTIDSFYHTYTILSQHQETYEKKLKEQLAKGVSFPRAHANTFSSLSTTKPVIDFHQPNNILGYSYVKTVMDAKLSVHMETIERKQSAYHDSEMTAPIASATSIRKHLFTGEPIEQAMPPGSEHILRSYLETFEKWHEWEAYFPYVHYRVLSMSTKELAQIYTIEEGIEHRLKETAQHATSFSHWMKLIKTKRYTWSRLQRMFTFILNHVTKQDVAPFLEDRPIPYIHLLGMTERGRTYLHEKKATIEIPIRTSFKREQHPLATLEERALQTYYSVLSPKLQREARKQAFAPPIIVP